MKAGKAPITAVTQVGSFLLTPNLAVIQHLIINHIQHTMMNVM